MKLSVTSEARDKIVELAKSSPFGASVAAKAFAFLEKIEKQGIRDDFHGARVIDIAGSGSTNLFQISIDDLNLIFARDTDRPDNIVLTNIYSNAQEARSEETAA